MAKGTQVTENGPFMHITTEEGQLEILERDRESSSGAAMEADFEERHEEGETMLDVNCDEIGMEKETGINGGGEMHNTVILRESGTIATPSGAGPGCGQGGWPGWLAQAHWC